MSLTDILSFWGIMAEFVIVNCAETESNGQIIIVSAGGMSVIDLESRTITVTESEFFHTFVSVIVTQ